MLRPVEPFLHAMRMQVYVGNPIKHEVWVDEMVGGVRQERRLNPRLDLRRHSPTGLSWGYGGSGPAQTALAIMADALGNDELAQRWYQRFKQEVISKVPQTEQLMIEAVVVRRLVDEWQLEVGGAAPVNDDNASVATTYTLSDLLAAAPGHMPLVGTDVEVVAYRSGADLVVLVNRGKCIYRATLVGGLKPEPLTFDTSDTFVIRRGA